MEDALEALAGIGVNAPKSKLHIRENTGEESAELRIEQADDGLGTGNLTLFVGDGAGYLRYSSKSVTDSITLGEDQTAGIQLSPRAGGNVTINSGNLGVGTTTPKSRLHVVGEANISGISGDGTGKVVCIKSDGNLGTCSSAVGAGGTCTCG